MPADEIEESDLSDMEVQLCVAVSVCTGVIMLISKGLRIQ